MAKFHINSKGEPGKCRALLRCPLGATEAEHYKTPEAARAAYEDQMNEQLFDSPGTLDTPRAPPPDQEPTPGSTPREKQWASEVTQDFNTLATPENVAEWKTAEPGTFKATLSALHEDRDAYTEYDFAATLTGLASGHKSHTSSAIRQAAHDLVVLRSNSAMAKEYDDLLKDAPLEGINNPDYPNPFKKDQVDGRKLETEESYTRTINQGKTDLELVEPFDQRWKELLQKVRVQDRAERQEAATLQN